MKRPFGILPAVLIALRRQRPRVAAGFLAAVVLATTVYLSVGYGLDFYLICVVAVAVSQPAMVAADGRLPDILGVALGQFLGGLSVWMVCAIGHSVSNWTTALCAFVLLSLLLTQVGFEYLAKRLSSEVWVITATTTILTIAWLSWPLWLGSASPTLIRIHPLLTLNGILASHVSVWTEQPVMYQLSALGQDVSYSLPATATWTVATHIAAGFACILIGAWWNTGGGDYRSLSIGDGDCPTRIASRSTNQTDRAARMNSTR